ncbi:sensor histidine kinase [Polaribacter aquimarinus]|uniref:histidine kinase n=1 Tax=Polaribacter aquimarinus TaxID=2100726 RepID=A0A2U2J6W8_9FLAO|nr:HAMP domain-containing sensor histidine kinase [Polaribacter aquimarinus]PWG04067.1 two-component sensor histidine kinase [Polaribacter aquimarinus]
MDIQKHKWIFYFIITTILATISIQCYWNYKNYEENKRLVTNEIQISLDNAIEKYYTSLAKSNFITIVDAKTQGKFLINDKNQNSRVTINNIKITSDESISEEARDSLLKSTKKFVRDFKLKQDSAKKTIFNHTKLVTQYTNKKETQTFNNDGTKTRIKFFNGKKAADSLKLIANLKPIFISFLDHSIEYSKIDSLIKNELNRKKLNLKTNFHHLKNDTLFHRIKDTLLDKSNYHLNSKSTYVKKNEAFKLYYSNPKTEALKRSYFGILLSLFLSLVVISSLLYLLKIINQQKDLANIKNDLISNITHEFKTPIATVSTAIEAIENFNVLEDKEKTKKYLSMSTIQLKKLHLMVEKLLETATLDSEDLLLKKESTDIVEIIFKIVQKHQLLKTGKEIIFLNNLKPIFLNIDVFHFENCISNLIDNAIKYGGNHIEVNINSISNAVEITVTDNGIGIEKNQQEMIFDKFYRVQKGNTHNVKGFGIGLYYCKKIIEKHQGNIELSSTKNKTVFKIDIPNE